jgi:trehalose synthase
MHCHLDISCAQEDVRLLVCQHAESYDAIVFDAEGFAPSDMQARGIEIIRPAIDPTGARNMTLSPEAVAAITDRYGIDAGRPLLCQLSPLDENCDPLGAIDVYDLAREAVPDLQLVLVASVPEEPLGRAGFDEVARKAMEYTGVSVLSSLNEVGNVEMNAFQRAADVVLQKDLQRGFGLWVSDALWKERPVVAARRTGLLEQVIEGETGLLAESTEDFSQRVVSIFQDRDLAARLGAAGRRHVRSAYHPLPVGLPAPAGPWRGRWIAGEAAEAGMLGPSPRHRKRSRTTFPSSARNVSRRYETWRRWSPAPAFCT